MCTVPCILRQLVSDPQLIILFVCVDLVNPVDKNLTFFSCSSIVSVFVPTSAYYPHFALLVDLSVTCKSTNRQYRLTYYIRRIHLLVFCPHFVLP